MRWYYTSNKPKIARERFKIKIYMLSVDIYIYLYINIYKTKNLWCKVFLRKSSEWRRMKFDTVKVYWKRNAVSEEKKRLIIVGFQSVSFVIVWMYFCNGVRYLYTHFNHLLPRFYFYNFFSIFLSLMAYSFSFQILFYYVCPNLLCLKYFMTIKYFKPTLN